MSNGQIELQRTMARASLINRLNMRHISNRRSYPLVRSGRQNNRPSQIPGLVLFQRQRQHFISRVYVLGIAFVLLTSLQWIFIASNQIFGDFFKERYYMPMMAGFTALLFITFFAIFSDIRYIEPYNWIFAYIIVELETVALLRAPLESNLSQFGICFLATMAINVILRFIGIYFPRDLTQDIIFVLVFSLIFYVAASVILILIIATQIYYLKLFLIIGTLLILAVFIMYVSQLIMGDRAGSLRWNDLILAALMVYFNFMLTLTSLLQLSNEYFY